MGEIKPRIKDIVLSLPSIVDREVLLRELAVLSERPEESEDSDLVSLEDVCVWLETTWSGQTVRAKAIQKAARMLRENGLRDT